MVDLVASLIVWLRTQTPMTGVTVTGRVPDPLPAKLVVVRRIGGPFVWPVVDQPTVPIEAWAATEAAAHDLCQDVRALVWSLRGGLLNGVAVYRVEEFAGPGWLPDLTHDRPRYTTTFSIQHREELSA